MPFSNSPVTELLIFGNVLSPVQLERLSEDKR